MRYLLFALLLAGCCSPETIMRTDTTYVTTYIPVPPKTDSSGTITLSKDSTEVKFKMRDSTVITYRVLPKDKERLARAVDSLNVLNGMLSSYIPKDSVLAYLRSIEKETTVSTPKSGWFERQIWKLILSFYAFILGILILKKAIS